MMDLDAISQVRKQEPLYSKMQGSHIRKEALTVVWAAMLQCAAPINLCVGWNAKDPQSEYRCQQLFLNSLGFGSVARTTPQAHFSVCRNS